jgi:hypothetical protein
VDGNFGQHDFATQAELDALAPGVGYVGLPNNGRFTGNGTTLPAVQLSWSNTTNKANCALLQNPAPDAGLASSVTFSVPSARYAQLQIYVAGTHGLNGVASHLAVTLTYADHSVDTRTVVVPAWDSGNAGGSSEYMLVSGLSSVNQAANTVATGFKVAIVAIDLNPNPAKLLVAAALVDQGGDPSQVGFETVAIFGATAWQ